MFKRSGWGYITFMFCDLVYIEVYVVINHSIIPLSIVVETDILAVAFLTTKTPSAYCSIRHEDNGLLTQYTTHDTTYNTMKSP